MHFGMILLQEVLCTGIALKECQIELLESVQYNKYVNL